MDSSAEQVERAPESMSLELRILLKQMPHEARKAKILRRSRMLLLAAWLLVLPAYALLGHLLGWHNNLSYFNVLMQGCNLILNIIGQCVDSEARKKWVKQLAGVHDVRACGAFADVLAFNSVELKKIASLALITHLPRLQASDSQFLNDSQRHNLRQALKGKNVDLILALLSSLQQVGDMRDWDAVQRLADGKSKSGKNPDVQLAAVECLPYLQVNTRRQELNQTLLRASSADTNTANVLLRASVPVTSDQTMELLRATAPSNEG